ncbi:12987_t:CDS:2, partial [Dentiscutata heterogama]
MKVTSQHANRNFQPSWKTEFPWLEYDTHNNRIFCVLCHNYNKKNVFVMNGVTNIKLYAIKEHAKTKDHTDSYRKNEKLNVLPEHINLMKIIYCLAKNNIPLNKFKPLAYLGYAIEAPYLVSEDHLITYKNNSCTRKLLSSISVTIEESIWKELSLATAIGIIVNESTDISTKSYIIIYVKYLIN